MPNKSNIRPADMEENVVSLDALKEAEEDEADAEDAAGISPDVLEDVLDEEDDLGADIEEEEPAW